MSRAARTRGRSAGFLTGLAAWLAGATAALACPVCLGTADGPRLTFVQRLVETDLAVLATRGSSPATFRAVALIKGQAVPQREIVPEDFGTVATGNTDTVVLIRRLWPPGWSLAGPLPADRLDWARTVARFKRSSEMSADDWQTRVRFFASDLDAASPMVAMAALDEITRAPYRAIRSLRGTIPAATLARWIDVAGSPQRRKLAILLAGLDHNDGLVTARLRHLSTAQDDGDVAALLTARLEIDGPAGIAKVEADWVMAQGLSRSVRGSALLAMRVHAEAEPELWRGPVGTAYRRIVALNPSLAGLAASHLESLAMWDAAPELGRALADGILPDDAELPVLGFLRAGPTAAAAAEAEAAIMARQRFSAAPRSPGPPAPPPPVRPDK